MSRLLVRRVDPTDGDDLADLAALRARTEREINPDDEPPGVDELAATLTHHWPDRRTLVFLAEIDGTPVAELEAALLDDAGNEHLLAVEWCVVLAEFRRRGVGRKLLAAVLDALHDEGRTSLLTCPIGRGATPGAAFSAAFGLELASTDRCSRLAIADLDRGLVHRWLDQGNARDDGYRLVTWQGPCPDQWRDAYRVATTAMADMPLDDLDLAVPDRTEDELRANDATRVAHGLITFGALVVDGDGNGAGMTELQVNGYRPWFAEQGDTGVLAAHRGRGLGRWLKAANLVAAIDAVEDLSVVETYNAASNPWMLDINVAMGFRPHIEYEIFQGDLVEARTRLG